MGGNKPTRGFGQEFWRGAEIPVSVADALMAQIAGENRHPADGAAVAPLPAQEDATGKGMPQIMQADVPPVGVRNEAVGQLAKYSPNRGVGKASAVIGNKEVLGTWKKLLPPPDVVVEWWQSGRV